MVDQNKVVSSSALARTGTMQQVRAQESGARAERSEGGLIRDAAQDSNNKFFNKDKKLKADNIQEISVLSHTSDNGDAILISTGPDYQMHQRMVAREVDLLKRERDVERSSAKQLKSLRLDMQRKDEQIDIMQRKMNSLVKSKVDLLEELEVLKANTNYEQAKLLQEIQQLKGSTDEKNKEERSSVIRENEQLKNQIQQFQNQNNLLMVELDAANEQQSDPNEVAILKHQIQDLENEKQILVVQLNAAKEQQSYQEQHQASSEKAKNGDQATQKKVEELEEELSSEQATSVELREQLAQVREQLSAKVDKLEMQLQLQKMKYGQAQARLMEMDSRQATSSTTSPCRSPSSSDTPPSLKHIQQLQAAEMRAAQAEQRAGQLAQELSKKDEEISSSQKNLTSLRQNLLSMNNQVVQLSSQVKDLQSKVKSKTGQLEIAQQQVSNFSQKLHSQKTQIENYKLQSLSLLGYFGARVVQNEQVVVEDAESAKTSDEQHEEISLEQLPEPSCKEEVVQTSSVCGSQSSMFKLKVYQKSSQSNNLQSQSQREDRVDLMKSEECTQCMQCGHIISNNDVSVAYNRAYSEGHEQDSCQPQTPQCSSFEVSPALVSRTNSKQNLSLSLPDIDFDTVDTAQSPRRLPVVPQREIENKSSVETEVSKYAAPLISQRSRAVLKILLGKQPWMVWIRRLLILSAAVLAKRNAGWFIQKFRQICKS